MNVSLVHGVYFNVIQLVIGYNVSSAVVPIVVDINLLATDFFFQILAHPLFKMWVIQKPNKVALWNKPHFEEEKMEIVQHV